MITFSPPQFGYSQSLEEKYLLEIFPGKTDGRILDVGAYNGAMYSNSLKLIELGWSAVCIEPSPTAFLKLRALHEFNTKVMLVNAAIGLGSGIVLMHDTDDPLATTEQCNYEKWKAHTRFSRPHYAPLATVEQITNHTGKEFDVISVDVEGNSTSIFLAMHRFGLSPKCWIVEHDGREVEILAALGGKYTEAYRNAENLMMVRR